MKSIKVKIIIAIGIAVALIMSICFYTSKSDAQDLSVQEKIRTEQYFQIMEDKITLEKALKKESPYTELSGNIKIRQLNGQSEQEAIKGATDDYLEKKAILWFANRKGIEVGEQELEDYLQSLLDDAKQADNYHEVESACQAAGITYEQFIRSNQTVYKVEYIKNILYMNLYDDLSAENETLDGDTFNEMWAEYKAEIVEDYKASTQYQPVKAALDNSVRVIQKDVTAVSKLKAEAIYVEK